MGAEGGEQRGEKRAGGARAVCRETQRKGGRQQGFEEESRAGAPVNHVQLQLGGVRVVVARAPQPALVKALQACGWVGGWVDGVGWVGGQVWEAGALLCSPLPARGSPLQACGWVGGWVDGVGWVGGQVWEAGALLCSPLPARRSPPSDQSGSAFLARPPLVGALTLMASWVSGSQTL